MQCLNNVIIKNFVLVAWLFTHWGQVTHIWFSNLTIIGSNNGLSPIWHQAIIWTNAVSLSFEPLRTHFRKIVFQIQTYLFKKMHFKMLSGKCQPFCLGLNVLNACCHCLWKSLQHYHIHMSHFCVEKLDFQGQGNMMTSSNGNIFRVTGHLCEEFTGHRWIPRTKASDAELWYFLWSAPE